MSMEEARRRLAVLCSHLREIDSGSSRSRNELVSSDFSVVSKSDCVVANASSSASSSSSSSSDDDDDYNDDRSREDENGKRMEEEKNCIFCKIIRGESPAFKIYEDDICLCILDINPLTHGHSLLIPKHHFSSLKATPPSVVASMCSKVPFVSNAIMEATNCDSFNLLVNTGEAAGQVIFHTHLHIIPRKARDCLWTSKSFRRETLRENHEAAELANCIKWKLTFLKNKSEDGEG